MKRKMHVLLLDDNEDLANHYRKEIERNSDFRVVIETSSVKAQDLAQSQLFDAVVIDAKLDYRGYEYGGIRLADELLPRYGNHSILVISRYITSDWIRMHGPDYEFLDKACGFGDPKYFAKQLCRKLRSMRKQQYAFVAMSFAPEWKPAYGVIKKAISMAGFRCLRADEVAHTHSVQKMIQNLVMKSKFVVLLADGANPNAYYEAGFADALKKELLIVAREIDALRTDLRDRLTLVYGDNYATIDEALASKISELVSRKPPLH